MSRRITDSNVPRVQAMHEYAKYTAKIGDADLILLLLADRKDDIYIIDNLKTEIELLKKELVAVREGSCS
jgi:hypothetical protein